MGYDTPRPFVCQTHHGDTMVIGIFVSDTNSNPYRWNGFGSQIWMGTLGTI